MEAITTNHQSIGMLSAVLHFASLSHEVVQRFNEVKEKKETEIQSSITESVFQFTERLEKKVNSFKEDLGATLF